MKEEIQSIRSAINDISSHPLTNKIIDALYIITDRLEELSDRLERIENSDITDSDKQSPTLRDMERKDNQHIAEEYNMTVDKEDTVVDVFRLQCAPIVNI